MSRPLSIPPQSPPSERELRFRDFERILKLVGRLGSPSEHEVVMAVKQLSKALQAVDLSWSDVAESIRRVGIGDVKPAKRPKSWSQMSQKERLDWIWCLKQADWLPAIDKSPIIMASDRFCIMPDPRILEGMDFMDDLIARARRMETGPRA